MEQQLQQIYDLLTRVTSKDIYMTVLIREQRNDILINITNKANQKNNIDFSDIETFNFNQLNLSHYRTNIDKFKNNSIDNFTFSVPKKTFICSRNITFYGLDNFEKCFEDLIVTIV